MLRKFLGLSRGFAAAKLQITGVLPEDENVWKILHTGSNPSTDYYIKPEIERLGCKFEIEHLSDEPSNFRSTNKLIIVRYLTENWAKWLHTNRSKFSEIIYFMDDDLLSPSAWQFLPEKYRQKLAENYKVLRKWLPKLASQYWVSTDSLRNTNFDLAPRVITARPLPGDEILSARMPDNSRRKLIFYHATASHYDEFVWIRPIVEKILRKNPSIQFELIGDLQINRLFRDLPRTRVLHPMSWETYLAYTSTVSGGLGLAPLLSTPFNDARSTVKRMDIDRMAAKGLYTMNSSYALGASPERSLFAPNLPDAWEAEIDGWIESVVDSADK